ncbi:MAG TPA: tetratricopeptide repeat protein, partial [Pararhizobium sp.]|nr:tetratricopeptide repeat protein [Pararhizobium sp.]
MQNEVLRRILASAAVGLFLAAAGPAFASTDADKAVQSSFDAGDIDSFAGAFLAARVADADKDDKLAISFYRRALEFQPDNTDVKERLMVTLFVQGDFEQGVELANELKDDPAVDRITAIARGVDAFRKQSYTSAEKLFAYDGDNDLDRLMNGLLRGWAQYGAGNFKKAQATIDGLKGPEWFGIFKSYSSGAMAEAAGRTEDARADYKSAITDAVGAATAPDTFMRAVIGLAEMEARLGNKKAALDAVATGERFSPGYPPLDAVRQAIEKGKTPGREVRTPAQGAATVLFSIGSALNHQGAEEVVALYLHFAAALDPNNSATRVMLGGIAEALGKPEEAIEIYAGIPESSPMRRLSDLQRGLDLSQTGKIDLAKKQLKKLIEADPNDMRSYLALGSVLSQAKDYRAMADLYDRAAEKIGAVPRKSDWNIFFQRGIAYERLKEWPKAEPNFKKALALNPDQPQVLNYLGYSWI